MYSFFAEACRLGSIKLFFTEPCSRRDRFVFFSSFALPFPFRTVRTSRQLAPFPSIHTTPLAFRILQLMAVSGRQLIKMADKSNFPHVSKSPWQHPWKPNMAWHAAGQARPVDPHDKRIERERRKTQLEKKRKIHERRVLKLRLLRRIGSMYI